MHLPALLISEVHLIGATSSVPEAWETPASIAALIGFALFCFWAWKTQPRIEHPPGVKEIIEEGRNARFRLFAIECAGAGIAGLIAIVVFGGPLKAFLGISLWPLVLICLFLIAMGWLFWPKKPKQRR